MSDDADISDLMEAQLQHQGVGCVRVSDGHVFTFTSATLEAMVEKARESGKVIVFVRTGLTS